MRNEVEKPMRENCKADDQCCRPPVEAAVSAANRLINESGNNRPRERGDQAVGIRMEIRVEHAARGKTFDHTQLLNSKQDQRRPDVIEKLHSDEQDPERNFISLAPGCESNAVMSDKHRFS